MWRVDPSTLARLHVHTALQLEGVDPALEPPPGAPVRGRAGAGELHRARRRDHRRTRQLGFQGLRPPLNGGDNGPGWVTSRRPRARESREADGTRVGRVSDETTNRAFWRHYRHVMESRA